MKNIIKSIILLAVMVIASSCGATKYTVAGEAIYPEIVSLDQLQYLGEMDVEVTSRRYLGIINYKDKINGEFYDSGVRVNYDIEGLGSNYKMLKLALGDVYEKFPEADYIMPVNRKKTIIQLFLGRHTIETCTFKAYKFND